MTPLLHVRHGSCMRPGSGAAPRRDRDLRPWPPIRPGRMLRNWSGEGRPRDDRHAGVESGATRSQCERRMREVTLPAADLRVLGAVVPPARLEALLGDEVLWRAAFAGVAVINVNSTPSGGGVAEMLSVLLPYARGAGVDARWL